jgi:amidophosphoribosyltransferase
VAAMKKVVGALNPAVQGFEASCFDGVYITGDVSAADFDAIAKQRKSQGEEDESTDRSRLALQNATESSR